MSTGRLTFLYPHLFRSVRLRDQAVQVARQSSRPRPALPPPPFASSTIARASTQAVKPPGRATEPKSTPAAPKRGPAKNAGAIAEEPKPSTAEKGVEDAEGKNSVKDPLKAAPNAPPGEEKTQKENNAQAEETSADAAPSSTPQQPKPDEAIPLGPPSPQVAAETPKGTSGPMDAILRMPPPPSASKDSKIKPPYLAPPPYVHYFDTYSLVKQLSTAGYTDAQAITAMKAVRQLLAHNLDVAQSGLVSKSDVENETYLFRAACSELSTEVKNNRRVADEQMRQQRTVLQHELDILSQSLNGELQALNDSVRGMFNDRRMAVREEQKAVESAIQQINYQISIKMTSDAKSEIEGLRWVLIRRSVLGIIFMAVLMFGSLRYGSYVTHEKKKEAERLARERKAARKSGLDGKHDHGDVPGAAEILAAN
ncbi:hypothetical protein GQ53DRAFT_857101 [Thozetella sp. PMI_491]|nr:hypothetical protein GQ53DRAFT_857101 [Thozetella sp. PMI_491]